MPDAGGGDVWTYDGDTSISDAWTPEDGALYWSFVGPGVFDGSGLPGGGPYPPGSGGAAFEVTPSTWGGGDDYFNISRYQTSHGDPVYAWELFLHGDASLRAADISHGTMTYDGADTITMVVHSSDPALKYGLTFGGGSFVGGGGAGAYDSGTGGDLTLTADVSAFSPGDELDMTAMVAAVDPTSWPGGFFDWKRFTKDASNPGLDPWDYTPVSAAGELHLRARI